MDTQIERRPEVEPRRHETAVVSARAGIPAGVLVLAGLYLAISPWVIQTVSEIGLAASDMIVGLMLAFLAVSSARLRPIAWVVPVIGVWVAVSPWVIYHHSGLIPMDVVAMPPLATSTWLSNVIAGAVVVLAGLGLLAPRR